MENLRDALLCEAGSNDTELGMSRYLTEASWYCLKW